MPPPPHYNADERLLAYIKSIGSLCSMIRNRFLLAVDTAWSSSWGLTWHLKARGL